MKRKIILNLAMSVDGFIASEDGGFDWITGDGHNKLDTHKKWDFNEFLDNVDVIVMGSKCYEQNLHKAYPNKKIYVATSKSLKDHDNIQFINGDICKAIEEERQEKGKNIYLFGGGITIDSFIKADMIDEYIIGIIPTILGKGRPLFLGDNPKIDLHLDEYVIDKGITILKYVKREEKTFK